MNRSLAQEKKLKARMEPPFYDKMHDFFDGSIQQLRKENNGNSADIFEKIRYWCTSLEQSHELLKEDIDILKQNFVNLDPTATGTQRSRSSANDSEHPASHLPPSSPSGYEYYFMIPSSNPHEHGVSYQMHMIPLDPSSLGQISSNVPNIFDLNEEQISAVQSLLEEKNAQTGENDRWLVARVGALNTSGAFGVIISTHNPDARPRDNEVSNPQLAKSPMIPTSTGITESQSSSNISSQSLGGGNVVDLEVSEQGIDAEGQAFDTAEARYQKLMEAQELSLGIRHEATLKTKHDLGVLYARHYRLQEAEALYRDVIAAHEILVDGQNEDELFETMRRLGWILLKQGRLPESVAILRKVVAGRERLLGVTNERTLEASYDLAFTLGALSQLSEAEAIFERILLTQKSLLGENHEATLRTMYGIARIYRFQCKFHEAEILFKAVLASQKMHCSENHEDILQTMHSLAMTYTEQNRLLDAEQLYKETLEGRTKFLVLGEEHPDTLWTMNNLASLYIRKGDVELAEPLYAKVLDGRKRILGIQHPDTQQLGRYLVGLYRSQRKFDQAVQLEEELGGRGEGCHLS